MDYFYPVPTSLEALKKLYKNLCLKYDPDLGGSEETMKIINREYAELYITMNDACLNNITAPIKASRSKTIKCIFTATRNTDTAKLHLLKYHGKAHQWLICWNYDLKTKSWDLGIYCADFKKALSEFRQKCSEYHFNEVYENYR
jgi:hypothetical protein